MYNVTWGKVLYPLNANIRPSMSTDVNPRIVTLPHVREMSLSVSSMARMAAHLPHILEFLQLPELTSLCVHAMSRVDKKFHPVFPVTAFDERLPNFAKIPELQVDMSSGEVTFRSQELPLHSVRRLTVNLVLRPTLTPQIRELTFRCH